MELVERTRQTNLLAQKTAQTAPTAPKLVRTVSAPVNEGLRLIGQPPVTPQQQMVTVTSSGALVIQPGQYNQAIRTILNQGQEAHKFLKEQREKAVNSQKEASARLETEALNAGYLVQRQSPQPGTSKQVVTGLIKISGSPNQEQATRYVNPMYYSG